MAEEVASYLFAPLKHASGVTFKNRIVMAPMTRARSGNSRIPNDMNFKYYTERADAGLIITEGASFSTTAHGWAQSAAIETPEQIAGWKKIVDAVHKKGGLICCQLWHTGRASHSSFQKNNAMPIAPSALKIEGDGVYDINSVKQPHEVPRALNLDEVPGIVQSYVEATKNCIKAGFDFVEIHGANGYLIDSFLQSCTNKRTDKYGGSVEKRFQFLKEIVEACIKVFPSNKIGVRLSPNGQYNAMGSADNVEQFTYTAKMLNGYGLAYLHVMDGLGFGFHNKCRAMTLTDFRKVFDGIIIGNIGYTRDTADGAIRTGAADLISFGRPYIGNPDLVERFKKGYPLATANYATWYSHDSAGYTDYPVYKGEK